MDRPLFMCPSCRTMFIEAEVEDWGEETIYFFCPSCGETESTFDEVPACHEMTMYWGIIEQGFDMRHRQSLKLLADRGMKLPDA